MHTASVSKSFVVFSIALGIATVARAQTPEPTRREVIEQEQSPVRRHGGERPETGGVAGDIDDRRA